MLNDVLAAHRDEVMALWQAQIAGTLAPEALAPLELANHIPEFLDEIVSVLRTEAGLSPRGPAPEESTTAAVHGAQRLRLGFSLDSVVREYGALSAAIVSVARDAGAEISYREMEVLFDAIIAGIARAVSEYTQQRDAELQRQTNEHFAFIAHELRNPLSSAILNFQILRTKGQLPADSRAVAAIERDLQRTSELIEQTLQIARVASGIELHRQATTLAALVGEAEQGAVTEAESKGVEIRTAVEADEPIELDTRLVRSALGNLVRNAVKYTCAGSLVEVRGRIANGRAVLEVEDCCGGLEAGKVEEAFAPFVRLDSHQSGFGLGLAIAKQAVDAHGGSIRVQNLPGKGCIFVLELPVGS
jgi:signal transduction histidine kinase